MSKAKVDFGNTLLIPCNADPEDATNALPEELYPCTVIQCDR